MLKIHNSGWLISFASRNLCSFKQNQKIKEKMVTQYNLKVWLWKILPKLVCEEFLWPDPVIDEAYLKCVLWIFKQYLGKRPQKYPSFSNDPISYINFLCLWTLLPYWGRWLKGILKVSKHICVNICSGNEMLKQY